ncbi:MAG TPA: DUF1223 domain-containing protein [Edaphobacter sp.]|nr:DUF1223 domain-containing protein [Edaphobacter sp.]
MTRLFVALVALAVSAPAYAQAAPAGTPVLVELFTSEGCSSCPPADKLLAQLQKQQPVSGAHIVAMEEHVDYWDHQGWRDRFSSAKFTQRQSFYAPRLGFDDSYTPQMVVDGETQFLGSDSSKAVAAISQAAGKDKIALEVMTPAVSGQTVTGSVVGKPGGERLPRGDLYAVLVQPFASTEVRGGENGGKQLNHVSVARSFARIGKIEDLARGPVNFKISAPSQTEPAGMRLVVFAQLPSQGAVRGIAEAEIHGAR